MKPQFCDICIIFDLFLGSTSSSVVFAGFSAEALRTRIVDGKCEHVQALVAQSVSAFGC